MPKPLPLGEVAAKQTERASPSPKSIYTAIRTSFCQSDAIAVFLFFCNGLALSVSLRSPAPPKGEPLAKRRGFSVCQGLPSIGEVARRRRDGEVFPRAGFPPSNLSVCFARQGRVAAPSVCFAVACILLAAAPTAPPCFRRWRRSSPLPLVGEPLAKRWHAAGVTERFSPKRPLFQPEEGAFVILLLFYQALRRPECVLRHTDSHNPAGSRGSLPAGCWRLPEPAYPRSRRRRSWRRWT